MKRIMKNKIGQMYRGDLKWFLIMLLLFYQQTNIFLGGEEYENFKKRTI